MTKSSPVQYKKLHKLERVRIKGEDTVECEKDMETLGPSDRILSSDGLSVDEVLDEKAALAAAEQVQTADIEMTDAPAAEDDGDVSVPSPTPAGREKVEEAKPEDLVDDSAAARGMSPTSVAEQASAVPSAQTQETSHYDSSPTAARANSYNRQMSLSRRLALANLPPITPVTTRSKERAAATVGSDDDRNLPPEDQGIPTVDIDLDTNTDYIALSSTLELLTSQRETASEDIATLRRLKGDALEDPDNFIAKLKSEGRVDGAPKMQSIVRAPIVRWNKYGISNESLEKEIQKGVADRDARFGTVRVFGEPRSQRKASV